jgi:hypothetical protein
MSWSMILVFALMLATAAIMAVGLGAMVMGGSFNQRYGNRLMMARVTCQGLTLAAVGLAVLVK